ncbi:unnamed protein product, partial [Pelagomonas calceolata]
GYTSYKQAPPPRYAPAVNAHGPCCCERRLRWRMNFILRRASATLRFFFSRASSWKRLCLRVRRWPDLLTSLRRRMMTESTLSPERVLILIDCRGAARGAEVRAGWKAEAVPASAPTINAATRRIVVAFFVSRCWRRAVLFAEQACVPRGCLEARCGTAIGSAVT